MVPGLLFTLTPACGDDGEASSGTATESTGATDTDDQPTTDPTAASNSGGNNCVPGASVACACTNGEAGAQVCTADGNGFGPCECEGGGSNSNSNSGAEVTTTPDDTTTTGVSGSDSDTTTDAGTTIDLTTTGLDTTTGDTTTGVVCDDPGPEPNEDEGEASELADQTCQAMPGLIEGVLDGDADVDWFTYRAVDGQGCGFDQLLSSHTLVAADVNVRMCVFAECDQGEADFDCPMMAMAEDSPDGLPGCCGTGMVIFGFNCAGTPNETSDFFVRVDQAPADSCVDYSVAYSFGPS